MEKISMSTKELSFEEVFEEFIKLKESNNLSKDSILYYKRCYKRFSLFFDTTQDCSFVNNDLIIGYKQYLLKDETINNITTNTLLRGLRTIVNYAKEEGYLKANVTMIKAEKKVKDIYTDDELKRLLKKPNIKKCSFVEYRSWVVTNFLLGTACRISTLINIKIEDIDFLGNEIIYKKTKNRKQIIIPLSQQLAKVVTEYLRYRKGKPEEYLFSTIYGNQISRRTMQQEIQRYNISRMVIKTSAHLYRNTFAKHYLISGGDMLRLQKILGHKTLEMVKEYVEMYTNDLQRGFNDYNPLDELSVNTENKIIMQV